MCFINLSRPFRAFKLWVGIYLWEIGIGKYKEELVEWNAEWVLIELLRKAE
jgi:hypothetical protein